MSLTSQLKSKDLADIYRKTGREKQDVALEKRAAKIKSREKK